MKPKLILLHGALGSSSQFDSWMEFLSPEFEVLRMDFSGHGKNSKEEFPWTIAAFSKQLENFIFENQAEGCGVFGYSMGGYVALAQAQTKSDAIAKIFTFATKFEWTLESAERESKFLDPEKIMNKIPAFAESLRKRHVLDWKDVCYQTTVMMKSLGENPVLTPESISEIEIPVRLGLGDHDNMVSLEETIQMYKALKNGERFVMEDTQHPIEKIRVEDICTEIIEWMRIKK